MNEPSLSMQRETMWQRVHERREPWDVVIVGGGATGLGAAIDAAARGLDVLLLEQSDFAKGTSSRSTKLVHGGVRYLAQGDFSLVRGALEERGLLRENAPHLVHAMPFVIPIYRWWQGWYYSVGMRAYDLLAKRLSFGRSRALSRAATLEAVPTVKAEGLRGGVMYYDGQFDDARLAIHMAMTAAQYGGVLVNHSPVRGLMFDEKGRVNGVQAEDAETGESVDIAARVVVNATGVFADGLRRMADPETRPMIQLSQGAHLVLDRSFVPGEAAIMVPKTDDGRVMFAIPWEDVALIGTTDVSLDEASLEPRPFKEELAFLLEHAGRYLSRPLKREDVRSVFAGLRPLIRSGASSNTARLSRDHTIEVSKAGLITIAGGKWTTYRKMAADVIDHAMEAAGLSPRACPTRHLHLHGHAQPDASLGELAVYGADAGPLQHLIDENPAHAELIHPELPHKAGEVIWAARHEMARTVEDVLARRTRALLRHAGAAAEAAPRVAELLAGELGRDENWQHEQVEAFRSLARGYMLGNDE